MTISIDLKPEVRDALNQRASESGLDIHAYLARVLEQASVGQFPKAPRTIQQTLKELAQFSDKIPALSEQAFTREDLYQDSD